MFSNNSNTFFIGITIKNHSNKILSKYYGTLYYNLQVELLLQRHLITSEVSQITVHKIEIFLFAARVLPIKN